MLDVACIPKHSRLRKRGDAVGLNRAGFGFKPRETADAVAVEQLPHPPEISGLPLPLIWHNVLVCEEIPAELDQPELDHAPILDRHAVDGLTAVAPGFPAPDQF